MKRKSKVPAIDPKVAAAIARNPDVAAEQLASVAGVSATVDRLLAKHPKASTDLLEKLSHSSDKATRKNDVLNANASKEVLMKLAPQFPGDFFRNPAFDWLLLEDPDLLVNLGQGVLKNILKRPECPASFMEWAAKHGSDQERLAVTMNPNAPAEVLQLLGQEEGPVGEAARAHEKQCLPLSDVDLGGAFADAVKDSLIKLTTDEVGSAWRKGSIGPAQWPWLDLRERLEILGISMSACVEGALPQHARELATHHDGMVRSLVAGSPFVPVALMRLLSIDTDVEVRGSVAANPAATPAILKALSNDMDMEARRLVAANPAATPAVLKALAGGLRTCSFVAANPSTPTAMLHLLAKTRRSGVRQAVAENAAAPAAVLAELAMDREASIRAAVAKHPFTPSAVLDRLAADPECKVRQAVAHNPRLSVAAIELLSRDRNFSIQTAAAQRSIQGLRIASDPAAPASDLEALARGAPARVRLVVARNPGTPPHVLSGFAAKANVDMWQALADNPSSPPEVRKAAYVGLIDRAGPQALEALIANPECPAQLRPRAAARLLWCQLRAVARKHSRDDMPAALPQDPSTEDQIRLLRQESGHLLLSPSASLVARVLGIDGSEVLSISGEAAQRACTSRLRAARLLGLRHPKAAPEALAKRSKATDWAERMAIAGNPSCPTNIIAALKKDVHQLVALQAQATEIVKQSDRERKRALVACPPARLELQQLTVEVVQRLRRESRTWLVARTPWWYCLTLAQRLGAPDPTPLGNALAELEEGQTVLGCSTEDRVRLVVAEHCSMLAAKLDRRVRNEDEEARSSTAVRDPKLEARLVQSATHKSESVRSSAARNPSTPAAVLEVLASDKSKWVRRSAADSPSTPAAVLEVLASDKDERVRSSAARNPSTPVAVLEVLASDKDERVRSSAARNPSTPVAVLEVLASDENEWVRSLVASNPSTPAAVLEVLASDKDERVRSSAARNPSTPAAVLEVLASDENEWVRSLVASNPSTSAAALEVLASDKSKWVRRSAAGNPSTPAAVLEVLASDKDERVRSSAADSPSTPAAVLEVLAGDESLFVRSDAARNPSTPAAALEVLARDESKRVRSCAARNPSMSAAVLEVLATDKDEDVRSSAASNPSIPAAVLEVLAGDESSHVRSSAAGNPSTPWPILGRLSLDKMASVRWAVPRFNEQSGRYAQALSSKARSTATPIAELLELAHFGYWAVRLDAVSNPAYPAGRRERDLEDVIQEITAAVRTPSTAITEAAFEPDDFIAPLSALNLMPDPSDTKSAAKAAKSKDWLARAVATLYPATQPSLLQMLLDDEVDTVRQLAIHRLQQLEAA